MSFFRATYQERFPNGETEGTHVMPTLGMFLWQGALRFGFASIAVFLLWAMQGRWFYKNLGEAGFYAVCAVAFMGLNGFLLKPLAQGRMPTIRFYLLFGAAFGLYSFGWCVGWFGLKGHSGEWLGSVLGSGMLALMLCRAFGRIDKVSQVFLAVFLLHSAGYFLGGLCYEWATGADGKAVLSGFLDKRGMGIVSKLAWGLFYGLGTGAGLGFAFHACQNGKPGTNEEDSIVPPHPKS